MPYYPTFFNIPQNEMAQCFSLATGATQQFQFLAACFIAENIAMGITNTNKGPIIANALEQVLIFGTNGALWDAIDALEAIELTPEMAPYLTQARINWMKNELQGIIAGLQS